MFRILFFFKEIIVEITPNTPIDFTRNHMLHKCMSMTYLNHVHFFTHISILGKKKSNFVELSKQMLLIQ